MSEFDQNSDRSATEAPSARRREQAHAQGRFAHSAELATGLQLMLGWVALLWFGPALALVMATYLLHWESLGSRSNWTTEFTVETTRKFLVQLAVACLPPVTVIMLGSLTLSLAERGGRITWQPIRWQWERLNPSNRVGRLFSARLPWTAAFNVLRMAGAFALAACCIWAWRAEILQAGMSTLGNLLLTSWNISQRLWGVFAGLSLILGLADFIVQWRRHEQSLMMTREDLKQEMKEDLGDPHLRAWLRRRQREYLKQRSIQSVPQATVVITNPTHVAVAIHYRLGASSAPRVLAKGTGELAQRIKRIARQHQVQIVENRPLARSLYSAVDIGQEIPSQFYHAVAEILAQLYQNRGY